MVLHNRYQIHISEYIFFLILFVFIFKYFKGKIKIEKIPLATSVFLYLGASILSMANSINYFASFIELIKMVYLAVMFIIIVNIIKNESQIKLVIKTWLIATGVVVFLGIIGIIMAYGFEISTPFIKYYDKYPYIGSIYRPISTMNNAKMLSCYLTTGMTLSLGLFLIEKDRLIRNLLFMLMASILIIMFFSFSRGILGLGIGVFIVLLKVNKGIIKKLTFCLGIALIFLFIIINVLTTWYLININISKSINKDIDNMKFGTMAFIDSDIGTNRLILNIEYIYTNYFLLKKSALEVLTDHPYIGIGIGTFDHKLKSLKDSKEFSKQLPVLDPHSTFFGKLAETGIIGFFALILLLGTFIKKLLKYYNAIKEDYWKTIIWGVFAAFIGLISEGINMDIMNFRFLWLLMGLGLVIGKVVSEQNESCADFDNI